MFQRDHWYVSKSATSHRTFCYVVLQDDMTYKDWYRKVFSTLHKNYDPSGLELNETADVIPRRPSLKKTSDDDSLVTLLSFAANVRSARDCVADWRSNIEYILGWTFSIAFAWKRREKREQIANTIWQIFLFYYPLSSFLQVVTIGNFQRLSVRKGTLPSDAILLSSFIVGSIVYLAELMQWIDWNNWKTVCLLV